MFKTIMTEVKGLDDCEDGGFNSGKLWKLKQKLSPRNHDPPTAMRNENGELLTAAEDILEEAANHYTNVFTDRPINSEYELYKNKREKLCMKRLKECSKHLTSEWTITDVTTVLSQLKKGKSKDACDLPNNILKPCVAGKDPTLAVTILMNIIKNLLFYPDLLQVCNVTNLYKRKGDRTSFNSHRGIFRANSGQHSGQAVTQ